jgi:hypothetical protein
MKTQDVNKSHRNKLILLFSSIVAIYVLTYAILSVGGRYEPSVVGTFGVEQYWWAPNGFYSHKHKTGNLGWNNVMCYIFLPLWWVDNSYIHNDKNSRI